MKGLKSFRPLNATQPQARKSAGRRVPRKPRQVKGFLQTDPFLYPERVFFATRITVSNDRNLLSSVRTIERRLPAAAARGCWQTTRHTSKEQYQRPHNTSDCSRTLRFESIQSVLQKIALVSSSFLPLPPSPPPKSPSSEAFIWRLKRSTPHFSQPNREF